MSTFDFIISESLSILSEILNIKDQEIKEPTQDVWLQKSKSPCQILPDHLYLQVEWFCSSIFLTCFISFIVLIECIAKPPKNEQFYLESIIYLVKT